MKFEKLNLETFSANSLSTNQLRSVKGGWYETCVNGNSEDYIDYDGCTHYSDGGSNCDYDGCE